MEKNNYLIFILLVCLNVILAFLSQNILSSEGLIYEFYSEVLTPENLETLIENQKKWWWLPYAIMPIIVAIRSSLVALCLSIGLFFYDPEKKLKFKELFNVTLTGEFVLVSVGFFKVFYFSFFKTSYTLQDIQQFFPLSYTNFLDLDNIEPWLIYPLQTLNLFEIGYFFILVMGLHEVLRNKFWKSFEMVAVSYGTGLTIWIGLVMFLTLNIS